MGLAQDYTRLLGHQPCRPTPAFDSQAVKGECVALVSESSWLFAVQFLELLDFGATPVVAPSDSEIRDLGIPLRLNETGLGSLPRPKGKPIAAQPNSYYTFSSGSTGQRKLLHFEVQRALSNGQAHLESFEPTKQVLQTLSFHHAFGLIAYIFGPLAKGLPVVDDCFLDRLFGRTGWSAPASPAESLGHLTPYHIELLRRRQWRCDKELRLGQLSIGSAPMSCETASFAGSLCQRLYATYGISEAGPRVTTGLVDLKTFQSGWIGWPVAGVRIDSDSQGQALIHTPYSALNLPEPLATGDVLLPCPDGSWTFRQRIGDVLRLRGQTFARQTYVELLEQHLECPCEILQREYDDLLLIFVQTENSEQEELMKKFPELQPHQVVVVKQFPRTNLGKINRAGLLALAKGEAL